MVHWFRGHSEGDPLRNVTITLDEETAKWARIEAAKRDTSVSRFVGSMLREQMESITAYERSWRSYTKRPAVLLKSAGSPYPTRDEIHSR